MTEPSVSSQGQGAEPDAQRLGLAQFISERTLRLLSKSGALVEDSTTRVTQQPIFYAWSREDRLVLVFNPLLLKNPDTILSSRFRHHLSTILGGRTVMPTNTRGVFLQIGYWPNPPVSLEPRPLQVREQPDPFSVPIGLTTRGALWLSILKMDSVLIGGSRRMGKTRLLHGWIQALQHGGQTCLYLWDGKPNCAEFRGYIDQAKTTVIGERDLMKGLTEVSSLMRDRAQLFAQASVADFHSYNAKSAVKLEPIVLVVDEVAAISLLPDAEPILRAIEDLISRGGAFGIYPVLATQRPSATAVRGISKTNLSTRISLPVPSHTDSQIILERVGAEKLPKVQGRLAIIWDAKLIEAQAFTVDLPQGGEVVMARTSDERSDAQSQPTAVPDNVRALATRCWTENEGKFTEAWLTAIGWGQKEARREQGRWAEQDWIFQNPRANRAWCLSPSLRRTLSLGITADESDGRDEPPLKA
ncbi:DNA translocase FtsK [Planctomycetaceae bacterium]|nr:DNA translocase FtsK [Planctomycetaceae bacterium]